MAVTDVLSWLLLVIVLLAIAVTAIFVVKAAAFDKDLIIAPFYVTGREDTDGQLARSLALMLQGRLRQLERDLEESKEGLSPSGPAVLEAERRGRAVVSGSIVDPVTLPPTALYDSPSINLKVAGIEFSGIGSWLSTIASRKRTLTFAVDFGTDQALVSANLEAFPDLSTSHLWLQTPAEPGDVVTALAYALLQARMAVVNATAISALEHAEFQLLLSSLSTIANLNRRIASGRAAGQDDFRTVLANLDAILAKVPEWLALTCLVAQITERSDQPPAHPPVDKLERAFVESLRNYERKLGLGSPGPDVGFMPEPSQVDGMQAVWNDEEKRYEVDPAAAADPTLQLEKHSALMSRFMAQHFGCVKDFDVPLSASRFWNGFRHSVVDFILETEPGSSYETTNDYPLLDVLRLMSLSNDVGNVRQLALSLLDHYDCDWNPTNLVDHVVVLGAEVSVPESVIREAFDDAGLPDPARWVGVGTYWLGRGLRRMLPF